MKASLVIFGVIFLVLGGLLYFVPNQGVTTGVNSTTAYANVTIPVGWAYASAIIGFFLLIFGLMASGPEKGIQGPRGPRGRSSVRPRRSVQRRSKEKALPKGTSVTTTTQIKR